MPPTKKLLAAVAVATLALTACGDDGGSDEAATEVTVDGEFGESATIHVPDGLEVTELVTEDLIEGDGEEVPVGATVTVHYAGVLLDGSEFDSSFSRGQTATFPLDGVIQGWTDGIPGMKVGGRRLLLIPFEQAYGAEGRPPTIPPESPLIFVVDLVAVG